MGENKNKPKAPKLPEPRPLTLVKESLDPKKIKGIEQR